MSERRKHSRRERIEEFYLYVGGQRMDSESLDISAGGAFLAGSPAPPPLSLVIIVPKQAHRVQSGIALVGAVRREQTTPVPGVGIEWLRCISRYGYEDVRGFLTHFIEFPANRLPTPDEAVVKSPVAAFSFRQEQYYVPDLPPSGEARPTESVPDEELTQEDVLGPLSAVFNAGLGETSFEMPVRMVVGETAYDVLTKVVGTRSLIVSKPSEMEAAEGMVILHFPIPLRKETTWVRLLCAVAEGPGEGTELLELNVIEMLHERNPGIFERFIRYLCERSVPE